MSMPPVITPVSAKFKGGAWKWDDDSTVTGVADANEGDYLCIDKDEGSLVNCEHGADEKNDALCPHYSPAPRAVVQNALPRRVFAAATAAMVLGLGLTRPDSDSGAVRFQRTARKRHE
eukprot:s3269_g1.t1